MVVFLFISALILGTLCVAGVLLAHKHDLKAQIAPTKATLRRYLFLFRWFLIGRYHCDLPKSQIVIVSALNKIFWGVVIICVAVCFGDFLQWI